MWNLKQRLLLAISNILISLFYRTLIHFTCVMLCLSPLNKADYDKKHQEWEESKKKILGVFFSDQFVNSGRMLLIPRVCGENWQAHPDWEISCTRFWGRDILLPGRRGLVTTPTWKESAQEMFQIHLLWSNSRVIQLTLVFSLLIFLEEDVFVWNWTATSICLWFLNKGHSRTSAISVKGHIDKFD